jgi:crotonobetainyl-CoA:carnitine CoA-transferase CaiB-like acyl-CoA transferase
LIWVRISGFGQDGPFAERPTFDSIIQARSGIVRARDGEATLATGYVADKVAGLVAAQAALAAVHERETSHVGSIVDVAMLDAMAYFNGPDLFAGSLIVGEHEPAVMRQIGSPQPLRTQDGWIIVSPVSGRQLKGLFRAVGHPEWGDRLRDAGDPVALISQMNELLASVLPNETTSEWERRFLEADVPASAVLTIEEHFNDPQVIHNRVYHEMMDPVFGKVRRLRYPARFNLEPAETDDLSAPVMEVPDRL